MSVGAVSHSQDFVVSAIARASQQTGADFDYLVRTATRESGLRSHLTSRTSSAAGPFQFIEQTWLSMLDRHGADHGYGAYADAIEQGENGRYQITDETLREEILALRHDPQAAALMAGEMTNEATTALEAAIGRPLQENEAYVAHFMGLGGATRLIREVEANPDTIAADLFPRAASANQRIFYNEDGSARTVAEVHANLTQLPETDAVAPTRSQPIENDFVPNFMASTTRPTMGTGSTPGSYTLMLTPAVLDVLATLNPTEALGDRNERSNLMRNV